MDLPEPPVLDPYPADSWLPPEEIPNHMYHEGDAETIMNLRKKNVAVIRAHYWGGYDQSNYDLTDLFDKDGGSLTIDVSETYEDYRNQPAVVAVDKAMGGGFNGAGVGREYGGHIEMRLDTLRTREINHYEEEIHHHPNHSSEWGSGAMI